MKPIIVVKPGLISKDDIQKLLDNGLCVIEAADPQAVRCLEPIPSSGESTLIEAACVEFTRRVLNGQWSSPAESLTRSGLRSIFVTALMKGTAIDGDVNRAERESLIIEQSRIDELKKIGREEARSARELAKLKKASPAK